MRTGGGQCGRGDRRRLVFAAALLLAAGTVPTAQTQSYEVITSNACGEEVTSLGECKKAGGELNLFEDENFVDLTVCDKRPVPPAVLWDCFGYER